MKVIHHGEEHLLCLSSEEVALLVDLCHAGLYSDLLGHDRSVPGRMMRFVGELQHSLFQTAQGVWRRRRSLPGRPVPAPSVPGPQL